MSRVNASTGAGNKSGPSGATEHLRDKAEEVGQNLREIGGQVREAAGEKFDKLRDQAGDYYTRGRDTAQAWEKSLEEYVQEKPLKAVIIAAGVGVLLGLLWKRS